MLVTVFVSAFLDNFDLNLFTEVAEIIVLEEQIRHIIVGLLILDLLYMLECMVFEVEGRGFHVKGSSFSSKKVSNTKMARSRDTVPPDFMRSSEDTLVASGGFDTRPVYTEAGRKRV